MNYKKIYEGSSDNRRPSHPLPKLTAIKNANVHRKCTVLLITLLIYIHSEKIFNQFILTTSINNYYDICVSLNKWLVYTFQITLWLSAEVLTLVCQSYLKSLLFIFKFVVWDYQLMVKCFCAILHTKKNASERMQVKR